MLNKKLLIKLIEKSKISLFIGNCLFPKRLIILIYHGVIRTPLKVADYCFLSENKFEEQMIYLKNNFSVVSLSDAIYKLKNRQVDRPIVVVTFDDGFLNNYEIAFPILKKYQIPATFFISTQLIDTDKTLWFCQLNHAISQTIKSSIVWKNERYSLISNSDKVSASIRLQEKLKTFHHSQLLLELNCLIDLLIEKPFDSNTLPHEFRMLTKKAIHEMSQSNLVEFGSHTHRHSILSLLSKYKQREEILTSTRIIEEITNNKCQFFSYPNGRIHDYNQETITLVQQYNFKAAVTTIPGDNCSKSDRYTLKRYGVSQNMGLDRFKILVNFDFINYKSLFS